MRRAARPDIADWFERVVVVNLRRRPDRLTAFQREIAQCNWPFKQPVVFEAIDGNKVPVPQGWVAGGGAWGCMHRIGRRRKGVRLFIGCSDTFLLALEQAASPLGHKEIKKVFGTKLERVSDIVERWVKDDTLDHLWVCHSQSCNIALHALNKFCLPPPGGDH